GGLSIVGSRNIDSLDQDFTQKVARQASLEGLNVVSGGARGVDEVSMLSALEAEGGAIGVLADSLYKAALSAKWRKYIKQQQLVLISAYYPEAGFNAGNAMGRNKYIYALSDFALIVRSDKGKGGTWAGAVENLKKSWVPSFVNSDNSVDGNLALIDMGAEPFSIIDTRLDENWLINKLYHVDLAGTVNEPEKHSYQEENQKPQKLIVEEVEPTELINNVETQAVLDEIENETLLCSGSIFSRKDFFYEIFKEYLNTLLLDSQNVSIKELEKLTPDVKKMQIISWLDRAEDEGVIERIGRARSYKNPSQLDLGGNEMLPFNLN
ncbi:Putative DNA processing chain A, partial [hydrothermal vent metagenome]